MSVSSKRAKQFRSRISADGDEEEEETREAPKPSSKPTSKPAKKPPKESKPAKATLLSFGDDEEEPDEAIQKALRARKAKASKEVRKAMDRLDAEQAAANATGPAYGASSGEYTAEKLAELKKSQPFQLPSKPKKNSSGRVQFDPTMLGGDDESNEDEAVSVDSGKPRDGSGTQILDAAEVRRLKERKERNRRIGMEDFIPLRTDKDGMGEPRLSSLSRSEEKQGKLAEVGEENLDEWEQEIIRRGARRTEAPSSGGGGSGRGAPQVSLFDARAAANTFRTVEEVVRDLASTKERVQEAHERNVRAAEKARAELEQLRSGMVKLHTEFDHTAERFQYFQEVRDYVSSLCGCLREKDGMVKELQSAMGSIRRENCATRWSRRIEGQEDELQALKDSGMLASLQGYEPRLRTLLEDTGDAGQGKAPQLDEFGRDKSYSIIQAKEKRREARLARRRKALARVGLSLGQGDTAEAEANMSDGDDSAGEMEVSVKRRLKLVEAGSVIFEDADEDFRSLDLVAKHFEDWKRTHSKDYHTAFVSLGLPQMLEPFVSLEMVRWEPLRNQLLGVEGGDASLENFEWYQKLFNYGQGLSSGDDDPDERLVPQLVERVPVSLMTAALTEHYDPLSSVESVNAIATLQHLLIYDPPKKALDALLKAPLSRLRECVKTLCIPLLQPSPSPDALDFQRRQVFRGVKLYRNLCMWHEVLSPGVLGPLALTELLCKGLIRGLDNQLSISGQGQGQGKQAVVECLGVLHVVSSATPPRWVADKLAPLKDVHKLLERLQGLVSGDGGDPLAQLLARLKAMFAESKKR